MFCFLTIFRCCCFLIPNPEPQTLMPTLPQKP